MIVFWKQILIAILLFIGSQRSLASPTTVDYLTITSTEEPTKHEVQQAIDGKEQQDEKHHWDCQAESDFIQKQIALTTKMLNEGEKITQKQKDLSADETVLVLGKAGSGKTSLVQFLTQNPKLQSKKVRTDTGEYIIEDGERIGTSATESFTLYPELVSYNSSFSFCDSPGFHDSRSSAHEIVSMDVMKSITNRFKKVKILLLENYSSLQYGFSKDNFIDTLRHLNNFLVDIDRYKDHIVLIASKIPLTYITTDDINVVSGIVTDEMHTESIMEYLNRTESSLAEKMTQTDSKNQKEFYQKVIKLLKSLQARDENGKATRINVFRRPYKSGPLTNMSLLEKNKESLSKTIMSLDYVDVRKNDFDFTLSDKAQLYLECLLKLTNENYKAKINELSFKLNEFITHKTKNYTSFHQVLSELVSLHDALKHLSENLDETRNYNEFFEKVNDFISDQKMSLPYNFNERIHVLEKYREMLLKFVDTSMIFIPSSWTLPIRQVIKFAEDELKWYETLNKFIGGLSSYKIQKNKSDIYTTIFQNDFTSTGNLMTLFVRVTGSHNLKLFIDSQADTRKRIDVETITNTLLKQSNITCDANGRLIVKGFQICLSEINSDDLVRSHCGNRTVKEVGLLAVDTVFLDEDTGDMFKGVNLFIAAPKWEVIGQRRIILSGQPGSRISDNPFMDNGRDGRPGRPGGNGGSFLGIGLQFLNGENLLIESNGGSGGPGADGAKGLMGMKGRDAAQKMIAGMYSQNFTFNKGVRTDNLANSILYEEKDNDYFTIVRDHCSPCCRYYKTGIELLMEDGDCGSLGGRGGMGGEAGIGGLPGEQELIELSESSQIKLESQNGSMGTRGNMGDAGDRGMDGFGMICMRVTFDYDDTYRNYRDGSYWKCMSTNSTSPACNTCQKLSQTVEYQYTTTDMEQPASQQSPDFIFYSLGYAVLLETHYNHAIFNRIITDFKGAIQEKLPKKLNSQKYNLNEMGLLFFKNLQ